MNRHRHYYTMAMMQVKFLLVCGCILPALTVKRPGQLNVSISLAPLNRVLYEGATNTTLKLLGETASRLLFFPDQNIDNKTRSRMTDENLQTKTRTSAPTTTVEVTSAAAEKTTTTICSSFSTSINYQCEPNLKNLVVYEGQLDIMMNLETDPQSVSWSVLPSSDEYGLQNIIDIGCIRNPSLIDLYDVKETGLVIKKAAIGLTGDPISTAGVYVGKCVNSTKNVGAKLLVIRYPCEPNLKNLAVYEGQMDILMNLVTDTESVSWSVQPSSDELNLQNIIDIGGIRNPLLSDFFEVKEAGLVIKKATVTGNPISTAGLYVGKCVDSADNVGAKLLVIRTGPQCSRTSIDTSSSGVSCNITFADSVLHPIRPIVTWSLNGDFLASYTLQMERIGDVFYAESTIATNGGANDNYRCEVTFDAPTEIQYPWIATNAPEFKESCSKTG